MQIFIRTLDTQQNGNSSTKWLLCSNNNNDRCSAIETIQIEYKKKHTPHKVNNLSSSAIKSIPNKCLNIVGEEKRNQFCQTTTNG